MSDDATLARQRRLLAGAVLGTLLLATWLRFAGPVPPRWLPPCLFHGATGLHCPGCGSARTLHALAHGELRNAWQFNPLVVLALPLFAAWGAVRAVKTLRGDPAPVRLPRHSAAVALTVLVVYAVLRNLPWWPCTLLAPHGG